MSKSARPSSVPADPEQWSEKSTQTRSLGRWSNLLVALEAYVPYRPHTAKKNMLAKLLTTG
ncbi:MAG TPA: hypothetical protein VN201_14205 [Roseateles sp.]|nr:hypothetical protein [Roseateles sp.]